MIFAWKMPEFYIKIARKFFSRILGGTCPPAPVSYAYGPKTTVSLSYVYLPPASDNPSLYKIISRLFPGR